MPWAGERTERVDGNGGIDTHRLTVDSGRMLSPPEHPIMLVAPDCRASGHSCSLCGEWLSVRSTVGLAWGEASCEGECDVADQVVGADGLGFGDVDLSTRQRAPRPRLCFG